MKAGIHALTEKDQKAIILNANFQPIGPDEQTVIDFVEFLGTLSRTSSLCPLTVDKWTDMNKVYKDAKEKMWDYVKNKLKRDHYTPYETTKMRWKNRPEDVSDEDFKFLLKKWKDPKYKELCKKNATNRAKQTNLHTCGPKSFSVIRERLVAQHLCSSVSFYLKQINPLIDIDPAVLIRLVTTAPPPGDASSALNHQSSVGLNRDSSIGTNKTHSEVTFAFLQYFLSF
ncbi:hypothetical protein Dimus_033476 [Dionaea muscipula]